MAKRRDEIAELRVNGMIFRDWTSVQVENRITEWFPRFTFECTEFIKVPTSLTALQFKPGDVVEVYLAGQQAVYGYVTERHVGYDAKNHGVRIIGVGKTFDLTNTSIYEQSGSYDNQSWQSFAQAMIAPYGIGLITKGAIDNTPFKNLHVQPGEIVAAAIERYARHRKIVVGSSPDGQLVALGDHAATSTDALVEGRNILRANAVIRDENVYSKIFAMGQSNGSDAQWGDPVNKQIAEVQGKSTRNRPLVVMTDIADIKHGLQQRANLELNFTDGLSVEAHITVQGWVRPNGQLWKAGDYYRVYSPMLMLDHTLGCRCVVYEQSSPGGTITTLEMVDPQHMNGKPDLRIGGL
ncbi:prophage tail gpP-like protein [Bradyrhizobium ottawaense]|uniref:phage baseplate assembly protein n=1 Tax=Bradyrhizobium ottawaense TaxID=931866 RepID=UPI003838CC36